MNRAAKVAAMVDLARTDGLCLRPAVPFCVQAVRMAVIGQNLDDAAFCHPALTAVGHHARQLHLQCLQPRNAAPHRIQVGARDPVGLGAGPLRVVGQAQQPAHLVQRKAQLARVPHKGEPVQVRPCVGAV